MSSAIKLAPAFLVQNGEGLLAAGYIQAKRDYQTKTGARRGQRGSQGYYNKSQRGSESQNKKMNPTGANG